MTDCIATRHGTLEAYRRAQCRCPQARLLAARYENERTLDILRGQSRTLPNVGALRRVHALRALGWPTQDLAERIGVHERSISRWQRRTWISRELHDAICQVYDELADAPGPDDRARRHAARRGWLPPLWWDDDTIDDPTYQPPTADQTHRDDVDPVAIERACAGDRIRLTRAERIDAVRVLRAQGLSLNQIAKRLRIEQRQVTRDLDEQLRVAS